jgi:TIGR04076 family protein
MAKVRLTVTHGECRCGYHRQGDVFVVEDLCPPLCHELWNAAYPYVFALLCGAELDSGNTKRKSFDARCPDGGRVVIHGELVPEDGENR